MRENESSLRALPLEGVPLRELTVQGNGKDAEISAVAADGRRFLLGTCEPSLEIALRGTVLTQLHALDDVSLRVRYTAARLVLERAYVDYPGDEADWEKDLAQFTQGQPMTWAIRLASFELVGAESQEGS
jgi:hypothetical protein